MRERVAVVGFGGDEAANVIGEGRGGLLREIARGDDNRGGADGEVVGVDPGGRSMTMDWPEPSMYLVWRWHRNDRSVVDACDGDGELGCGVVGAIGDGVGEDVGG